MNMLHNDVNLQRMHNRTSMELLVEMAPIYWKFGMIPCELLMKEAPSSRFQELKYDEKPERGLDGISLTLEEKLCEAADILEWRLGIHASLFQKTVQIGPSPEKDPIGNESPKTPKGEIKGKKLFTPTKTPAHAKGAPLKPANGVKVYNIADDSPLIYTLEMIDAHQKKKKTPPSVVVLNDMEIDTNLENHDVHESIKPLYKFSDWHFYTVYNREPEPIIFNTDVEGWTFSESLFADPEPGQIGQKPALPRKAYRGRSEFSDAVTNVLDSWVMHLMEGKFSKGEHSYSQGHVFCLFTHMTDLIYGNEINSEIIEVGLKILQNDTPVAGTWFYLSPYHVSLVPRAEFLILQSMNPQLHWMVAIADLLNIEILIFNSMDESTNPAF